jgi:hypothetical protein
MTHLPFTGVSLRPALANPVEEGTDVQAKFPEVAAAVTAECWRRWEEIIASGRSFAPAPAGAERAAPKKKARPAAKK